MEKSDALENPVLRKLVDGLVRHLGDRLHSVVLYGSSARGDFDKRTSDMNVMVVLEDLEPSALEALAPALTGWRRRGRPMPRLFSPALIADAADVFPIEFLDIQACRVVLHGPDPFATVTVHHDHLRLQCEREMREKMMRLREGLVEAHGNARAIRRLLTGSYGTFVALFRGCLHLLGGEVPLHNDGVVAAFCAQARAHPIAIRRGGPPEARRRERRRSAAALLGLLQRAWRRGAPDRPLRGAWR